MKMHAIYTLYRIIQIMKKKNQTHNNNMNMNVAPTTATKQYQKPKPKKIHHLSLYMQIFVSVCGWWWWWIAINLCHQTGSAAYHSNIKVLDLSHNVIAGISAGFFRPAEISLTHLYLAHNQLTVCWFCLHYHIFIIYMGAESDIYPIFIKFINQQHRHGHRSKRQFHHHCHEQQRHDTTRTK